MPVFLDPNAQELNDLRSVKKGVVKALKRQYKGTESTAGLRGDVLDKYNFLYSKMVDIIASLGEISNQLKLSHSSPSAYGSRAMDRFISGAAGVLKASRELLNYMSQQVPSINIFNTEQKSTISGLNDQMVSSVEEIDQLSTQHLPPATLARFREVIRDFQNELMMIQQRLEGQGTGTIGERFAEPSARRQGRRRTPAAPSTPSPPAGGDDDDDDSGMGRPQTPKRGRPKGSSGKKKSVRDRVELIEGKGYAMPDMYGDGYRTAITAGMMPSRFL